MHAQGEKPPLAHSTDKLLDRTAQAVIAIHHETHGWCIACVQGAIATIHVNAEPQTYTSIAILAAWVALQLLLVCSTAYVQCQLSMPCTSSFNTSGFVFMVR